MVTSYRIAKNQRAHNDYVQAPLFFETFPYTGLVKTYSYSNHVTDSAASAVAMYTGRKVDNGYLGMRAGVLKKCTTEPDDLIEDGIGDRAVDKGIAVGVVTNTRITHGTPAALYAKGVQRKLEYDVRNKTTSEVLCSNDIALQILNRPAIEFQVLMGGGRAYLMDATRSGKRSDGRNIDVEWENSGGKRKVLRSRRELEQYEASENEKVLGEL
ncbi:Alkaline phosphatase, partial [Trichostrongylus colubriformis]